MGRASKSNLDQIRKDLINNKMKSFIAICALAAHANAAASTWKECLKEEGAAWKTDCRSLWYAICDEMTMLKNDSCNIETYGDA